jgi:hypothetical protein
MERNYQLRLMADGSSRCGEWIVFGLNLSFLGNIGELVGVPSQVQGAAVKHVQKLRGVKCLGP